MKEHSVWILISITLSEDDADEVCGVLSCRKQKVPVQIKLKRRILCHCSMNTLFFYFCAEKRNPKNPIHLDHIFKSGRFNIQVLNFDRIIQVNFYLIKN